MDLLRSFFSRISIYQDTVLQFFSFIFQDKHMDNHFHWYIKHMWTLAIRNGARKEARKAGREGPKLWSILRCMVDVLGSMTAVAARSNSSPRSVHAFSLLILLLFSQETGSSPLPAQRITSCCLSGGGRLFVLEQIRSDRGLELILRACEAERQITCVCQAAGVEVQGRSLPGLRHILSWHLDLVSPPRPTCCDQWTTGGADITGCRESYNWLLTCLWRGTHLPSWFLSMTSNCFLSHLHRDGRRKTIRNQWNLLHSIVGKF